MDRLHHIQAFDRALEAWSGLALLLVDAAEAYRAAHASAFNEAKGTDTARKAAADQATSGLRLTRDKAEIEERRAYHQMIFLRGSAGEREEQR